MARHHHHSAQLPRAALIGAGVLIVFAIAAASVGRLTGLGVTRMPAGQPLQVRELSFVDRRDGGVAVREWASGEAVARIAPGNQGFVRGVLRGFARARRLAEVGEAPPFVLTRWADGRLSLHDPATGHFVALEAFGLDNAAAFARLLPPLDAAAAARLTQQQPATGPGGHDEQHNG